MHLEMIVFSEHTQAAIARGDRQLVTSCFHLGDTYYASGNRGLRNAVAVSFVEHLALGKHPWAWELLPARLKEVHMALVRGGMVAPLPYLSR
jgi:hypothetical protein